MITSAQNARIKLVRSLLGRPKERREAGAFLAEGLRLVEDAHHCGWPFRFVLHGPALSPRAQALLSALRLKGVACEAVSDALLASISETESPQGILAVLEDHRLPLPAAPDFLLIPDLVRDPGNLGTLLRTAAAAAVAAVLVPPETTDPFAPKVLRAGMGAHFRLPIIPAGWEEIRAGCNSMTVCLADMGGTPCWQLDLRRPLALIVGGEAEGASASARALAQVTISIPMAGGVESLNAGAAGAVLMFEVARQRRMPA